MPLPTWPFGVPYRPDRAPYNVPQRFRPPVATPMEDGPERMRTSSSSVWSQVAYQLDLKNAEHEILDQFATRTLAQATRRFWMPVGRPNTPDPWPNKLCYVEPGTWSPKPNGPDRMLVTFTLNVLDW